MTTPRKRRSVALSLFAFQDIITSVTAIMILLVLILTLELVTRTQGRGVATEDRRVARELRETVEALAERVESVRAESQGAARDARRAAGLLPGEIVRRTAVADAAARLLAEENAARAARIRSARADQRAAEARLVDPRTVAAAQMVADAAAIDRRAGEIEEVNRRERDRQEGVAAVDEPPVGSTLVFNRDPDNTRIPVLVDVSADGLDVLDDSGRPPRHFAWRGDEPGEDFNRWVAGLDPASRYVALLLRPSAVGRYDGVRGMVTETGIGIGLELVGESMTVVLPAGGEENR